MLKTAKRKSSLEDERVDSSLSKQTTNKLASRSSQLAFADNQI